MYFTPKITTKGLKSPEGYCSTMNLHDSKISYFDVGGQFAKDLEKAGSKAGIDFVLQTLRDTFGSDFDKFFVKGHMTIGVKIHLYWVLGPQQRQEKLI